MKLNIEDLRNYINEIPFVKEIHFLEQREFYINGKIEIDFEELENSLNFDVEILPQYPLKTYDSESITFKNESLIEYNHVMGNGSICIHTLHNINLKQKLINDFNSLKNWIIKYYINKDNDLNYEHIILSEKAINDSFYSYVFTDLNNVFLKGEFGDVKISYLNNGIYKEKTIFNYLVQSFNTTKGEIFECNWSNIYKNHKITNNGFYIFIEDTPAYYKKFAFKNWCDFKDYFPDNFLDLLHKFEKENIKKFKGNLIPLFIGYRTIESEIHWQVLMLEVGKFPLSGIALKTNDKKNGKWATELTDKKTDWCLSRNSSYKNFFGRGKLTEKITESKILVIGIGAIGSILTKTLTRGGCKYIDFIDYDIKEYENVCRSEYMFYTGLTNKSEELKNILSGISPFLNNIPLNNNYFETIIKTFHKDNEYKEKFLIELNKYDIIFDCSTDDDLMWVLSGLNLKNQLVNLSITNYAKELVCAFHPNIYSFVNNQFTNVLENNTEDLYNPTGCWSPTFKASYNDINLLVQVAIKRINNIFENNFSKNNFIIKPDDMNLSEIKITEF
jgi:hypothetical protein